MTTKYDNFEAYDKNMKTNDKRRYEILLCIFKENIK